MSHEGHKVNGIGVSSTISLVPDTSVAETTALVQDAIDRASGGGSLAASEDADRFNGDKRKQASVVPTCPMHALYLRNCHEVELKSPRLRACGGAERIREESGEA